MLLEQNSIFPAALRGHVDRDDRRRRSLHHHLDSLLGTDVVQDQLEWSERLRQNRQLLRMYISV